MGVKPIFVFDGTPPTIKSETTRKRRERRAAANEEKKLAKDKLFQNLLKMHAIRHVERENEDISESDIERIQNQLREDEHEEDFFISSDYKKVELISSDEEDDKEDEKSKEELHRIVRTQFLAQLTSTENVDITNPIFNNLTYSDQLGILDDVREIYKFGRSQINPFQNSETKSEIRSEEDDVKFSGYQLQGILARGKMRSQIREIEDKRKADRVHDLLLGSPKKMTANMARKVGQKYAIFNLESDENLNPTPPRKKVRTVLDLAEAPKTSLSESSEDEFIDVSDQSENGEEDQKTESIEDSAVLSNNEKSEIEKAIALSLLEVPGTSQTSKKIPEIQPQLESDWSDSDQSIDQKKSPKRQTEEEQIEEAIKMSLMDRLCVTDPPDHDSSQSEDQIATGQSEDNSDKTERTILPEDSVSGQSKDETVSAQSVSSFDRRSLLAELNNQKESLLKDQKKMISSNLISDNRETSSTLTDSTAKITEPTQITEEKSSEQFEEPMEVDLEENRPRENYNAQSILAENAKQRRKLESASRISSTPTQNLYLDAAELLDLFGVGIIFAPGEAEAQCANMELDGVTSGTITEDGDTFLFGGKVVYRGLSVGKMIPIKYDILKINIERDEMLSIAQLTGSDYCPGVKGVGPKTAKIILAEFKPIVKTKEKFDNFEILSTFGKWWRLHHKSLTTGTGGSKFRAKLKKLTVDRDFPCRKAQNAYLNPEVEKVHEKSFRFTVPDLGGLRKFSSRKMNWTEEKVDQHILPILKEREKQTDRSSIRFYLKK